jgi:hypothetical protein
LRAYRASSSSGLSFILLYLGQGSSIDLSY